ncbi:MAG: hypothetical protein HOF23_00345 [Rhodospirillaceae bacterium]|nr:hypothetical protein [Rhodospirillaceae bacterium]MBT7268592.1 hypothetical protein [Rhodospirillaceae bacterium]
MARYELTLEKNVVTSLERLDDDEEEMLGLEWALSEIKETYNHSGEVSTFFTLADEDEVDQILDFFESYFGEGHDAGVAFWRDFREKH